MMEGHGDGGRKIGVCHVKNTKHPHRGVGTKGKCFGKRKWHTSNIIYF